MKRLRLVPALFLTAAVPFSAAGSAAEPAKAVTPAVEQQTASAEPAAAEKEALAVPHVKWISDLAEAQKIARAEKKDLLLFFTGSDWCVYCSKLEKAVFSTSEFSEYIASRYVPVILDFPHGTPLPEPIATQNEKLKGQFEVASFPSVYIAEVNLLPYGKIAGFSQEAAFWKNLKTASARSEKIRAASGNQDVLTITNPATLDRVVELVPGNLLGFGWSGQIERLVATNVEGSADLKEKWSNKLAEIQAAAIDQEIITAAQQELRRLREAKASSAEFLKFFDAGIAEAQERPARLQFFIGTKSQYLRSIGEYDQALATLEQLLAMPEVEGRTRAGLERSKVGLYLSMGRIEEGLSLISKVIEAGNYPSEEIRQQYLLMAQTGELQRAGQATISIPYLRKVLENPSKSNLYFMTCLQAEMALGRIGMEHELRGHVALSLANVGSSDARAKNMHALTAAICFRAANRPDLAADALALVGPEEEFPLTGDEEKIRLGRQRLQESRDMMVRAANGTKADALHYLANQTRSLGKATYLLEAALARLEEKKTEEADQLGAQATKWLETEAPHTPDTAAKEHLQKLLKQWTAARS